MPGSADRTASGPVRRAYPSRDGFTFGVTDVLDVAVNPVDVCIPLQVPNSIDVPVRVPDGVARADRRWRRWPDLIYGESIFHRRYVVVEYLMCSC